MKKPVVALIGLLVLIFSNIADAQVFYRQGQPVDEGTPSEVPASQTPGQPATEENFEYHSEGDLDVLFEEFLKQETQTTDAGLQVPSETPPAQQPTPTEEPAPAAAEEMFEQPTHEAAPSIAAPGISMMTMASAGAAMIGGVALAIFFMRGKKTAAAAIAIAPELVAVSQAESAVAQQANVAPVETEEVVNAQTQEAATKLEQELDTMASEEKK